MEDTTLLYGPDSVADNAGAQNNDLPGDAMDSSDHPFEHAHHVESEMVDMVALMDALQCVGVEVTQANRFVASLVRKKPSIMEIYGRGRIVEMANSSHRDLNVLGDLALDLRTLKPSGEAWDFTKKSDRLEALQLVRDRKPKWVIGSPPRTAFFVHHEFQLR